jgi:hypothetical protein
MLTKFIENSTNIYDTRGTCYNIFMEYVLTLVILTIFSLNSVKLKNV